MLRVHTPKGFAKWVLLGLGAVLLLIWQQVQSTRLGYRLEAARSAIQSQQNLNAYLRMELERWRAPARLAEQARRRLRMETPAPAQVIVLADSPTQRTDGWVARWLVGWRSAGGR